MADLAGDPRRSYGSYEVESVLGRGAMGMVYLARDRRIGRRVALKTVHVEESFDDDSEAREFYSRLQREAELCGALQHPNIVTLYEPGYENDVIAWLATEYVDGETLRDRMRKRKPLPVAEAVRIAEDILRGLVYAHGKGIVHRDIKPANILLTSAGDAKIADFGIARPLDSNLTAVGEMLGTPSYMSPEQVKCTAVTARSDLFSLGAVLYEMLTGIKAFGAPDVSSILRNVVESDPKPAHEVNPEVPSALWLVLARLLAKNPDDRYPTAAAALDDLLRARGEVTHQEPVEELSPAAALSPEPPHTAREASTQPSVTAIGFDDMTPAFGSRSSSSIWRRRLSAGSFFGIVAAVILAVGAVTANIRARTDASATSTHSVAELREFESKRIALENARKLYSAGEYEASVRAYDDFVKRYPESVVAREERVEAHQALDALRKEQATVNVAAKRPRRKPVSTTSVTTQPAEQEKKRGFWDRLFGRQPKDQPAPKKKP